MSKNNFILLFAVFLFALILRFLYFPENTYFGFDQARDAYAVKEILEGDFKVTGPPTANGIFRHGVMYYYFFTPFYFFSNGDPVLVSAFLRILNAAGVFIVYPLTFTLFGGGVALLASFLFAISYEQTQFALFLNHPSLAVLSVLIFYLGLAFLFFKKRNWGLYLAAFGLGLSIQFEFVETQLLAVFILSLILFRKVLPKLNPKYIIFSAISFLLPISTYLISEIKNDFTIVKQLPKLMSGSANLAPDLSRFAFIINRHLKDNFSENQFGVLLVGAIMLVSLIFFFTKNLYRKQLIFISLWFFGGLLVYFITSDQAYFYNTGTSVALLIFAGFLLSKLFSKNFLLVIPILLLILFSNLNLVTKNNPSGPNDKINPQKGLLIEDEKKAIDFIYQKAEKKEFSVNALTMPYNVNTTWSYLFEWYGKKKYGYVPVWGGDAAEGFPGNLKVETARSKLPQMRFLIIEPQEGIPVYMAESFLRNEEVYSEVLEKKQFGTIEVRVQKAK